MIIKILQNICTRKINLFLFCQFISISIFAQFIPGNIYFDSTGFVEYRAGNLPVIISAPHGGNLEPDTLPDRDCVNCVTVKDAWTLPITEGIYDAFNEQTECYPHVIINRLHRVKFDANRNISDAANGNATVEKAWRGYHAFIDSAKNKIELDFGRGLFLDLHGHGHPIQRIELGYLLSGMELSQSDSIINTPELIKESSIRTLVGDNIQGNEHSSTLRGNVSLGTLLTNKGFSSVPSLTDPFPISNDPYFSGGYNTQRHGSRDNEGPIDAIQIELNQEIRFDSLRRIQLIDSLTLTINQYFNFNYDNMYLTNFCNILSSISEKDNQFELTIFPNPTSNYFNFKSELTELEFSIYNLFGQRLMDGIWTGGPISIESLQKGYYMVKMKWKNQDLGSLKLCIVPL